MKISKLFSFIAVGMLVAVVFAGLVATPAVAAQTDTMQFRYNAQHTGDYSPVAGSTPPNNVLKWKFATLDVVKSSPAVANGIVYVASLFHVYAIDATTGAEVWNVSMYVNGLNAPAVANGVVYLGSTDESGWGGAIHALNAATGAEIWSVPTPGTIPSAPTVADGVVYVGEARADEHAENHFYALDAATGDLKWTFVPSDSPNGAQWHSSPAVSNGIVYAGSGNGYLYALDAATGDVKWTLYTGFIESAPAVANGVVYVGSGLYAIDATTGVQKWRAGIGSLESSPAVANGLVYIGSNDHKLNAIDPATGMVVWSFTTGDAVQSSPAYANGVVYVGSLDHNVYAIDATRGTELWKFPTGDVVTSSPAIFDGTVYIGSIDKNVYAIGNQPAWGAWTSEGGKLFAGTGPAAYSWGSERTGWFVTGTDQQLYHSWTGHSGWESLGGVLTSSPAATSSASGVIDVFVRGSDSGLWSRHYSAGSWGAWTKINGQLLDGTGPAAYSSGGLTGVFVTGTDNRLYWSADSSGNWVDLGGVLTASPAATSSASGVIDVFVRGSDGVLYSRNTMNGGTNWSPWSYIGGQLLAGTGPAAYAYGDRVGWFVTGTDNALWHMWDDSTGLHGWQSLGGVLTSSPASTSPATGQIAVFVRGTDGDLYERTYT